MAVSDIGSIPKFDCKGESMSIAPRWRKWKKAFEYYILAKGVDDAVRKKALLLHCAGMDVQELYNTLTDPGPVAEDDTVFDIALRTLDSHFIAKVNITYERHVFRKMCQSESESTDQYCS